MHNTWISVEIGSRITYLCFRIWHISLKSYVFNQKLVLFLGFRNYKCYFFPKQHQIRIQEKIYHLA